ASLVHNWKLQYEANSEQSLVDWLPTFYDQLMSTFHIELQWCEQVFDKALKIVCDMLSQTLVGLDPPLPMVMSEAMQETPLITLI
ncbi:conserved oligomeric Golgi complex subunit 7-like, partial [Saccoglossus kowalevskii]